MKIPAASIRERFSEIRQLDLRAKAIAADRRIPLMDAYRLAAQTREHTGTHPVFQNTCDDHQCWCHTPECQSKVHRNGERCSCGTMERATA